MRRDAFWSSVRWLGLEHLDLRCGAGETVMNGLVIARLEDETLRVRYEIRCQPDWAVRSLRVDLLDRGRGQALLGDGTGRWRHPDGGAAPWLDGCIDVDLSITPATNTLPIRRLRLSPGESRAIQVLYVAFPTLDLRPVEQRYTRLQDDGPCAVYRYESGTFRADLRVDGDGLVLDYPGVWQRRTSP